MKNIIITLVLLCLLVGGVFAQSTLKQPNVYVSSGLTVGWTAGTVLNGGHAVTIAAGTTLVTTNKPDCAAPTYTNCNFLYANSAGVVANTSTLATATASGNSLLAIIETSAGGAVTRIAHPSQSGTLYMQALGPLPTFSAAATPASAAGAGLGTAALPWANLYMGTAATNNFVHTPAATGAARVITWADPGGAATVAYTNSTTAQPMTGLGQLSPATAGNLALGTAALPWGSIVLGTAATNVLTVTPAAAGAARAITLPDPGGAASIAYTNPTTAQTVSNTTLTDFADSNQVVSTAQLDKQNSDVLATVTGLSVTLTAAKTYVCQGHLSGVSTANGGMKVATVASGGLTATSSRFTGRMIDGTTNRAVAATTTLGNSIIASTTAGTDVFLDGVIVVNAGGTINVQFAQNAAHNDTSSVYVNSWFACQRIN